MTRRRIGLAVVAVAILVALSLPAGAVNAASTLDVAVQLTSDSDFDPGAVETNVTIDGGDVRLNSTGGGNATTRTGLFRYALNDPSTASTAIDDWNSNDGSINGPTYTSDAKEGEALDFDGHDDVVDSGVAADQDVNTSWAIWVNPDSPNDGDVDHLFGAEDGGFDWAVDIDGGSYHVTTGSTITDTGVAATEGAWQHVGVLFDPANSRWKLYLNGSLEASGTLSSPSSSRTWHIGADANGNAQYDGQMDDVRFYQDGLTATDFQSIYDRQGSGKSSGGGKQRGQYVSQNVSADATKVAINRTLENASLDYEIQETEGATSVVANGTFTNSGNSTVDISGASESEYRINVTFHNESGSPTTAELHDVTWLFDSEEPIVDNASATPQSGTTVTSGGAKLRIPVNDSDFATPQGDSVDVEVVLDGSTVSTQTITTNQTVTHTTGTLSAGSHSWNVTVTDSYGEQVQSQTFSFIVNRYEPTASDVGPADGTKTTSESVTFDVNVSDRDFSLGTDTVTATLYRSGPMATSFSQVYQTTVSSNSTVSTTEVLTTGGDHKWYWVLSDSYSSTADVTTTTRTVTVPSTLYIRNVSAPQGLLSGPDIDATVTLFPKGEGSTIQTERQVSDGTVNLTGLPVESIIVARVTVDGYYTRYGLITDIYDQQSIYLLNKTETAYPITFELQDRTGRYSATSSYLILRRALNTTGSGQEWQAIAGDGFDATGSFQATLQPDQRYQLVVMNSQGDQRVLGSYDPPDQETIEPLPIGSVSISGDLEAQGWSAGAAAKNVSGTLTIGYRYYDPDSETGSLTVEIYNTTSNTRIYSTTFSGPIRTQTGSIGFPGQQVGESYNVTFRVTRNGQTINQSVDVGTVQGIDISDAVGPGVLTVVGYGAIAVTGLAVVTASSSAAVFAAALVATLLSILGWLPIHPVQVGVAMAIGIVYHFASR